MASVLRRRHLLYTFFVAAACFNVVYRLHATAWSGALRYVVPILRPLRAHATSRHPEGLGLRATISQPSLLTLEQLTKSGYNSTLEASPGRIVQVYMHGNFDDGEVVDFGQEQGEALEFVCGDGQTMRGLDAGVRGMRVGETRKLSLKPHEAFGAHRPELVGEMELSSLPKNLKANTRFMTDDEGGSALVVEIHNDTAKATIDFNRAYAGKNLQLTVQLIDCKEPPEAERIQIEIRRMGDSKTYPQRGDNVMIHYEGVIAGTGQKIASTRGQGQPYSFQIGMGDVIEGLDMGLLRVSLGEVARLKIPSKYCYGEQGAGIVGPNTELMYEVELLAVNEMNAAR